MQDLSNQYLIEKREPQPASSSSRSSSLGCSVLRTNYMSSVSMIYEVWLPTLITFCPQHHPRTHNFRCPPSSSLILEEPWLCSALNCWYSHSAHVSEHICNRLEIILKIRRVANFSWTKRVNFCGHFWWILVDTFVHEKSSFWVNFRGHFVGEF